MGDKQYYKNKVSSLIEQEKEKTSGNTRRLSYAQTHQTRFDYILDLCDTFTSTDDVTVLDVGRSELTHQLDEKFSTVMSMGFPLEEDDGGHRETADLSHINHIAFDLNTADNVDVWPEEYKDTFDLIVFSETVEHIYTAPEFCLLLFRYLLKPGGNIILTTPNATSIYSRIRLLLGVHPYERFRYYKKNPGHFREYTTPELLDIGRKAGLQTIWKNTVNFSPVNLFKPIGNLKYLFLKPLEKLPPFRAFIVMIYAIQDA